MGVGSVGSQRRGARSYTCGLRSDPQALGRGAHIRVDLSQPPDKSRLRIFDPDHRSVDLCDDDPTDAQKASEGHRVRASQTSSRKWVASYENFGNRGSLNSRYPMLIAIIATCHRIADAVGVLCRMSRGFVLNAGTSRTHLLRLRKPAT